jgi:hypothetical protein
VTLPLTERLYEPLIHHEALESGPGWAEVLADESSPFRKTSLREWSCAARPLARSKVRCMSATYKTLDYKELLQHSFEVEQGLIECGPESRLAYLSRDIFDFTTYDGSMDELFARKAVEVCAAITNRATFEYIKDAENYRWFLLMCNMPFFQGKLNWGGSIRGAWWDAEKGFELQTCGLWLGNEQLTEPLTFSPDEWKKFIAAVIEFAAPEMET